MTAVLARVGDLAQQIRGVTYSKSEASNAPASGSLPVLRAGNITEHGLTFTDLVFVPESRVKARQRLRRNDVLIAASSGSLEVVGKAGRAVEDFEGGFGAFCKVLRPNERVDPNYFAHFFKTTNYRRTVSSLAAGANINNLRSQHLDDLQIPLPPVAEQRRIAAILDQADALRAKGREALTHLDDLIQSIFLDMFGDPRSNPMGLPVSRLRDVCLIGTGSTPGRNVEGHYGGTIPWVKTGEVAGTRILATEEHLTELGRSTGGCRVYPVDSIVMALYGQGKTRGRCAVLGIEAATNQACAVLQPDASYETTFLFVQLRLSYERLRSMARGGNQANLNLGLVGGFEVLVPDQAAQREFSYKIDRLSEVQGYESEQLARLDSLFASLQSRAFAGKF